MNCWVAVFSERVQHTVLGRHLNEDEFLHSTRLFICALSAFLFFSYHVCVSIYSGAIILYTQTLSKCEKSALSLYLSKRFSRIVTGCKKILK